MLSPMSDSIERALFPSGKHGIQGCGVEGHSYTGKHRLQVSRQSQFSMWKTILPTQNIQVDRGGAHAFGGRGLTPDISFLENQ